MKHILFLLFLIPFNAHAVDPAVEPYSKYEWDVPTQRADEAGTPLPPEEIAGYKVFWGNAAGDYQFEITPMLTVPYADGTTWNPGSGKGLYIRNGGVWVFIG